MKNERPEIVLLPCPFCGGMAIVYEHGDNPSEGTEFEDSCYMQHDAWLVGCEVCDVWQLTEDDEPDEAATLWNTRTVK